MNPAISRGAAAPALSAARPQWKNATVILITINVAVFVLMVLKDNSALMQPTTAQLIRWGADFGPLTLADEPWRLITSGFLHIGIIHILVNMWSLWVLGRLAEKFVGASSLIWIYLLTGLGASLASLAWDPGRVSAGASGPIFGFVGAMIGILYFAKDRLDPASRKGLLSYVVRIAVINLFLGLRSGTDNMAHAGGLVTGAAIGSALALMARGMQPQERPERRRNIYLATLAILALLFVPVRQFRHDVVYAYQGQAALLRKDYPAALANFQSLSNRHPDDPEALAALGYSHQLLKQYPEALQAYQRSLQLAPDQPDVQINIATIYAHQGKANEAVELFSANMNKAKMGSQNYKAFGEALMQIREPAPAENMFQDAIKLGDKDPELHADLAKALRMQGRTDEAKAEDESANQLRKPADRRR